MWSRSAAALSDSLPDCFGKEMKEVRHLHVLTGPSCSGTSAQGVEYKVKGVAVITLLFLHNKKML